MVFHTRTGEIIVMCDSDALIVMQESEDTVKVTDIDNT